LLLLHASTVLFLAPSVTFLFVPQISPEPLNGLAQNSHGRRVWSLARMSLNVKVKGQGHQGQKRDFHSRHPRQQRNGTRLLQMTSRSGDGTIPSLPGGVISAACVRCMVGKTSLALVIILIFRE